MEKIPFHLNIPPGPRAVMDRLAAAGFCAHAVGGCVRDTLLGRVPGDWDLTTCAPPEAVRAVLEAAGMQVIDTGLRHGTVTALAQGGPVEVTTYRVDGPYLDGRRPQGVTFTQDLAADLARRDFTINAMAADGDWLCDPTGGKADLARGLIRAVGDPRQRFGEDGLRILRALRFAAQLGFGVETATARALRDCAPMLEKIAPERVSRELLLLLPGPGAEGVLREFAAVIGEILPEIRPCVGFDQRNRHHIYDVWEHTLRALGAAPPDPLVRLTLLLHDLGKPGTFSLDSGGEGHFYGHGELGWRMAADILARLRLSSAIRERVLTLVKHHDSDLPADKAGMRRWLRRLDSEGMAQLIAVKRADNLAQSPHYSRQSQLDAAQALLEAVAAEPPCLKPAHLALSGRDVMALGVEPGPALGRILAHLLEAVTDGRCANEYGPLLALARKLVAGH